MLSVEKISISFDAVAALRDVSLTVDAGEVAGLIGPNGSGKTTLFNCICGYYAPSDGRVTLEGREITRLPPHKVARLRVGRTFQTPNLFSELSVFENVHLAAESMAIGGAVVRGLLPRRNGSSKAGTLRLLNDVGINKYADAKPLELPVGIAKLADLARALAVSPKILLLDEPAAGLNDAERSRLAELLRHLNARDRVTMLVVDHNMGFVMSLCSRLTVLASARVISTGSPAAVRADPAVIQAYLGDEPHAVA
jgi:branched-chain amino acid transport system permease protein